MTSALAQLFGVKPARRGPRKRAKALRWPTAAALDYGRELRALARQTAELLRKHLVPMLPSILAEANVTAPTPTRQDDASDTLKRVLELVKKELGISGDDPKLERMARKMLGEVNQRHAINFDKNYGRELAVNPLIGAEQWLQQQMTVALTENVRLIRSIPEQLLSEVEGIVLRGVTDGLLPDDIAARIKARFGVAESRALLIASDQTGKWFGQLNRLRQVDAGVEEYIWSTSKDGAVRPSHRAREGKRFRWDSAPSDGHPGMPVRCRCQPVPVVDDDLAPPQQAPEPKSSRRPRRRATPSELPTTPAPPKSKRLKAALPRRTPAQEERHLRLVGELRSLHAEGDAVQFGHVAERVQASARRLYGLAKPRRSFVEDVDFYDRVGALEHVQGYFQPVRDNPSRAKLRMARSITKFDVEHITIHEVIHGLGGVGGEGAGTWKRGALVSMEEWATETLAQDFTYPNRQQVRLLTPPSASLPLSSRAGAFAAEIPDHVAVDYGGYTQFRSRLALAIAHAEDTWDEAVISQRVVRAAMRWKSKNYSGAQEAMEGLIEALEANTDEKKSFYQEVLLKVKEW